MLTEQTKVLVNLATRLLCGARVSSLVDQSAAVTLSGQAMPCSVMELQAAQALATEVRRLLGTAPDEVLTDPEWILQARTAAEDLMLDRLQDQRMRILFVQDANGGCAWWRCKEPSRLITELYPDIRAESIHPKDETQLSLAYDAFVIQRGFFGDENIPRLQHRIARLKEANRVICYEIDDDVEKVHLANAVRVALSPRVRDFLKWLREESDLIFTTTEHLKSVLGYPDKTIVAPNSFDFAATSPVAQSTDRSDFLLALWHGGESHELDLEYIRKPLIDFITTKKAKLEEKVGKRIIFGFMGWLPEFLSGSRTEPGVMTRDIKCSPEFYFGNDPDLKKRGAQFVIKGRYDVRYIGATAVTEFHQMLVSLTPDICFCPLDPRLEMNASKSLIKAQESILAGAATIVSDGLPFSSIPDGAVLKCRTPEQMMGALRDLIVDQDKRTAVWKAGNEWLRQGYDLRVNASIWVNAIRQAMEKKAHD